MAQISYRSVSKIFGERKAIRDVDIDVKSKEFMVFVGPSGCGKSTLLRMLAGLTPVSEGAVHINGEDVTHLPPKDRDVAMVFQNYALYPHMTAAENIGFPLRVQGMSVAARRQRVEEAAAMLNLNDILDRYPRELSGGQRQRVAMGRAIVRHPTVFLFDEPLSNLDAALRVQMRKEIKLLHERIGATTIYVTHDQVEAMTMADRVVVLRNGQIEQCAGPSDIYAQPANEFVARFIGSPQINLIDCIVRGENAVPRGGDDVGQALSLSLLERPLEDGQPIRIGIRPEDISVTEGSDAFAAGRVTYVEANGQDAAVTIDLGFADLTVLSRGVRVPVVGQRLGLVLPPRKLHFFDGDGSRLKPVCS